MPCSPDLSGSENISLSIGKGSSLDVSAGVILSLIIASDVSKRAEEEGVFRVMKFTLCFTPLVRHAYAFWGFVLAMSFTFNNSFLCFAVLPSRKLLHVSWLPWLSRVLWFRALSARLILQTSPRRGPFFLSSLSFGISGRWRIIHILDLRFLESWTFHIGRISVRTHFQHLHTIYGLRSLLRFSVSARGSQLRTCTLQAGHLAWYLLLTIVLFRCNKVAMGMNMIFFTALKRAGQMIFMFSSASLRLKKLKAFVASIRRTASFSSKFALSEWIAFSMPQHCPIQSCWFPPSCFKSVCMQDTIVLPIICRSTSPTQIRRTPGHSSRGISRHAL